jgi:hypothetical protein
MYIQDYPGFGREISLWVGTVMTIKHRIGAQTFDPSSGKAVIYLILFEYFKKGVILI